jgi:hypothetical protein
MVVEQLVTRLTRAIKNQDTASPRTRCDGSQTSWRKVSLKPCRLPVSGRSGISRLRSALLLCPAGHRRPLIGVERLAELQQVAERIAQEQDPVAPEQFLDLRYVTPATRRLPPRGVAEPAPPPPLKTRRAAPFAR